MKVELTNAEVMLIAQAGAMRRLSAIRRSRVEPYGAPCGELWGLDIESCGAEYAAAKVLDCHWQPYAENPHTLVGDVGEYQVRSTWRPDGRLILHDADADESVFVLVTGRVPTFVVVGFILGRDGKDERYLFDGDGRPAFFVPQPVLNPL